MLWRRRRQLLFVAVGATCFLVQFAILSALSRAGVSRTLANALGFVVSAQLNFVLSARLTWRDRPAGAARTQAARLLSYNLTALLSLAVNTAVFALGYHRLGNLIAAALGVLCGMSVTYLVCDLLIFRSRRKRLTRGAEAMLSAASPAADGLAAPNGDIREPYLTAGTASLVTTGTGLLVTAGAGPLVLDGAAPFVTASPPGGRAGAAGFPDAEIAADGVTIVMPAYREEYNLATTVADFLRVPTLMGVPHCVVVVDDGSQDRTGEVADRLAAENPGRVLVVHHPVNRGYGAAVSTGLATALERTDHRWIFFTDSDGQFRATQLPEFLRAARTERADAVFGYREHRADPLYRRVNAFLWTTVSRLLLPVGVKDVDCSYKLIDRRSLRGIKLTGAAATVSPELVAKLRLRDTHIIERPVEHFPRRFGEQTGAKPSVIIRSVLSLLALSARIGAQRAPGRVLRRLLHPKDAVLALVTTGAIAASIASYVYFVHRHATLAYPDAISHLLIARRVVNSPTPGAAQLGAVWLPLPHLLASPLIWVNAWYYSGFAGSAVSMAAYVLAVRYTYLIAKGVTGTRAAGLIAAVAFGANPNVLYLQTTPMTELLLVGCIAASVYYLLRWCQTARYIDLAATGAAGLLASLTRYEGWVMCMALALAVAYVAWRSPAHDFLGPGPSIRPARGLARFRWWSRLQAAEANVIFFATVGMSGIVGWVLWNAVIFHDALYFQTGPFAKPSLWVSHADKAIGHWGIAALTYLYAMIDNAGALALALGAAGLIWYLICTRLRPETIAPLTLLSFIPFYVYALYSGQRPLHVTQLNGSLYNVRFGLLMVLPTAIFIGCLATLLPPRVPGWLRGTSYALLGLAALACAGLVLRGGITTLTEALDFRATSTERANAVAADWLRSHYTGGTVLMESFGNETVTFASRLPLGEVVYEGSFREWGRDLENPAAHGIRWIYMRSTPGNTDEVYQRLHGTAKLDRYHLVYHDPNRLIYELGPAREQHSTPKGPGGPPPPAPAKHVHRPPHHHRHRGPGSRAHDGLGTGRNGTAPRKAAHPRVHRRRRSSQQQYQFPPAVPPATLPR
jgi:putative flippase GtrA